jgi:hypothetical protein
MVLTAAALPIQGIARSTGLNNPTYKPLTIQTITLAVGMMIYELFYVRKE